MIIDFKTTFDLGDVGYCVDGEVINKVRIKSVKFEINKNGAVLMYNDEFLESELLTKDELITALKED